MKKKIPQLFFTSLIVFFLFFLISLQHTTQTCAYSQGSCLGNNAICYGNPTQGQSNQGDLAPGFQCGDATNYVYEGPNDAGGQENGANNNSVPACALGNDPISSNDGSCCLPGTPIPSLPPHNGYDLGAPCGEYSVCYTGNYKNPIKPGDNCGDLTGWHVGNDGSSGPAFCGLGGSICCDTPLPVLPTPVPPNPCPNAPTPGVCMSISTALGNIDVSGPGMFVKTIFGVLLSLAGGVAVILIIISGYRIMAAQGDPEKVKEAREMLTSAVIGLLFMIFSVSILQILGVDILKIPGLGK